MELLRIARKMLACIALACAPAAAADLRVPADADPAMWVVKDEDTTIYLFGTFHLLDGRRAWFNDEVKAAFDAADELVVEAVLPENPAELQPMVARYAIDPEGRALSSELTEEQHAKLRAALASLGVPVEAFDRFEPWFVSMTLANLASHRLGITAKQGAETTLLNAARERGMPIGELEGVEYQLGLFDGMPREMQLKQLAATLDQFHEIADEMAPMLAAWSAGEVQKLADILNEHLREYPELYAILLTQRNASWAEWIGQRLDRPGTVFVAVGAGHLAGKDSVQELLAARGLEAERVVP